MGPVLGDSMSMLRSFSIVSNGDLRLHGLKYQLVLGDAMCILHAVSIASNLNLY